MRLERLCSVVFPKHVAAAAGIVAAHGVHGFNRNISSSGTNLQTLQVGRSADRLSANQMTLTENKINFTLEGRIKTVYSIYKKMYNQNKSFDEIYDFYVEPPRSGRGRSFPSRHAFSALAIGVSALPLCPVPAIIVLALSVLMCIARVLVGIHFIRDVAAGAAIGVISAILGIS